MPELPDVEVFKKYLRKTSLNKKIVKTEVLANDMLGGISETQLKRRLKNQSFSDTHRVGKYLFVKCANNWLVLHFGMTGFLSYHRSPEAAPRFTRLFVEFDNGFRLSYSCMRKLGIIDLTDDLDAYTKKKELGKDPLDKDFTEGYFLNLIKGKRGSLKSFFMNQKYIAGLGNIYADEIFFHTNLHPKDKVEKVSEEKWKEVYKNMMRILDTTIKAKAEIEKYPKDYLIHYRKADETCPKCGGRIRQIKINSRSTYFCESHQGSN